MSEFKKIWQGRDDKAGDARHNRWHHVIQDLSASGGVVSKSKEPGFVLLGFCCDEGVARNQGRTGAIDGPQAIRQACANFPWHFNDKAELFDAGDVRCDDGDLEHAQLELTAAVMQLFGQKLFPIVLGGGHETAFGHGRAVYEGLPEGRVGIINFDAHFDLRDLIDGKGSSGTPFFQLAQMCQSQGRSFDYFCVGIQKKANTEALYERANQLGVRFLERRDLLLGKWQDQLAALTAFMNQVDHVYVSVCLDAFDAAVAPGVSAPTSFGLQTDEFYKLFHHVMMDRRVRCLDVVELCPRLDVQERTAKLAAGIIFEAVAARTNLTG